MRVHGRHADGSTNEKAAAFPRKEVADSHHVAHCISGEELNQQGFGRDAKEWSSEARRT
jgi:hypothetical protein